MSIDPRSAEIMIYGCNTLRGVVSAEFAGAFIRLFIRQHDSVTFHDYPFEPFIITETCEHLIRCPVNSDSLKLSGENPLNILLTFDTWQECCTAHEYLLATGCRQLFFSDPVQQFLIRSGTTLFKGMFFSEIQIMAVSTSISETPFSWIVSIAFSDGSTESMISADYSPGAMLDKLETLIKAKDPDIIISNDIHGRFLYDLTRISGNSMEKLKLRWGRNASYLKAASWRGEQHHNKPLWEIYGRSLLDSGSLKRHTEFTLISPPDGLCSEKECFTTLKEDIAKVKNAVARSSIFPASLHSAMSSSNASGNNLLLIREHMRRSISLPAPESFKETQKLITPEIKRRGLFTPVVHWHFPALFSAIISSYRIAPEYDNHGIFSHLINSARKMLYSNSNEMDSESSVEVISSIINSAYRTLLTPHLNFSSETAAAEILRLASVIIKDMMGSISARGGNVLEVSENGLFFVLPNDSDPHTELLVLGELVKTAVGVHGETGLISIYKAILLVNPEHYALLDNDDNIYIKGNMLKTRGIEPYLKEFMYEAVSLILKGRHSELTGLHKKYVRRLIKHEHHIEWITRSETLTETKEEYLGQLSKGFKKPRASYEVALRQNESFKPGYKVKYYVSGSDAEILIYKYARAVDEYRADHNDINVTWYTERLNRIFSELAEFSPEQPELF